MPKLQDSIASYEEGRLKMPSQFFCGQVLLLLKRCCVLRKDLQSLKTWPEELNSYLNNVDTELDSYRRSAEELNILEISKLTLMYHFNDKDYYFYKFAKLFCENVQYIDEYPLVNAHSSDYFSALPTENIINIPLCEDNFLLAIPDFVHELGHLFYNCYENEIF